MKMKKIKNIFALCCVMCACALFFSCAAPSPLYGTWSDNNGDEIVLNADGSFTSKIQDREFNGKYEVLLNVISFSTNSNQVVSEWDVRANLLYLTWLNDPDTPIVLTLYKTKN